MPAVFPSFCEASSANCLLFCHHFLSKILIICLNQLIQFYSNNTTNLHHLTTRSRTVLPHKMEIVLRPPICDVTSPYVCEGRTIFSNNVRTVGVRHFAIRWPYFMRVARISRRKIPFCVSHLYWVTSPVGQHSTLVRKLKSSNGYPACLTRAIVGLGYE